MDQTSRFSSRSNTPINRDSKTVTVIVCFAVALISSLASIVGTAAASAIDACDKEASQPYDPRKPTEVEGVWFDDIRSRFAVTACENAVNDNPTHTRMLYQYGRALEADNQTERALKYISRAVEQGYPAAMLTMAYISEENGDHKTAFELRYRAANSEEGSSGRYPLAHFEIADKHYRLGVGVELNENLAFQHYLDSARSGDIHGMAALGLCFLAGLGTEFSRSESDAWFSKAEQSSYSFANFLIGTGMIEGFGWLKTPTEGVRRLRMASDAGLGEAAYYLAELIGTDRSAFSYSYEDAFEARRTYYLRAIELGIDDAIGNLSKIYLEFVHVSEALEANSKEELEFLDNVKREANYWFNQKMVRNDPQSQFYLRKLREMGVVSDL